MITHAIRGNIHDDAYIVDGREIVTIAVDDESRRKRVQRLTADDGTEIGLKLPAGHEALRDGDVAHIDDTHVYVIRVSPTDVLVIHPRSIHEMGVLAHTLGNRHAPAQFAGDTMIVQPDHTVTEYLDANAIPYTCEQRVLPYPFRHAEHTH